MFKNPRTLEKEMAGLSLLTPENPSSGKLEQSDTQRSGAKQTAPHDLVKQLDNRVGPRPDDIDQHTVDESDDASLDDDDFKTPPETEDDDDDTDGATEEQMKSLMENDMEKDSEKPAESSLEPNLQQSEDISNWLKTEQARQSKQAPTLVLRHAESSHTDSDASPSSNMEQAGMKYDEDSQQTGEAVNPPRIFP